MDGLDLETIYTAEWRRAWGTTVGNGYQLKKFLRTKAKQLAEHFDAHGWPESEEEVLTYVHRTLERYG